MRPRGVRRPQMRLSQPEADKRVRRAYAPPDEESLGSVNHRAIFGGRAMAPTIDRKGRLAGTGSGQPMRCSRPPDKRRFSFPLGSGWLPAHLANRDTLRCVCTARIAPGRFVIQGSWPGTDAPTTLTVMGRASLESWTLRRSTLSGSERLAPCSDRWRTCRHSSEQYERQENRHNPQAARRLLTAPHSIAHCIR